MDPAELAWLQGAVASQGQLLGQHENVLLEMNDRLAQLVAAVQALTVAVPPAAAPEGVPAADGQVAAGGPQHPAITPREPNVQHPERYSGDAGSCRGFLSQCSLVFTLQPSAFTTDGSMVAYIMTLLSGRALAWANALLEKQSPLCSDFAMFTQEMRRVFDCPVRGRDAATRLLYLRQGRNSVANYAIDFRVLAAESDWTEAALVPTFLHGLSDEVKDELVSRELSEGLDSLITLAIQIDNRIREHRRARQLTRGPASAERSRTGPNAPDSSRMVPTSPETAEPAAEESMQLGRTKLSLRERERRIAERLCMYCGKPGHFRVSCPEREGKEEAQQ